MSSMKRGVICCLLLCNKLLQISRIRHEICLIFLSPSFCESGVEHSFTGPLLGVAARLQSGARTVFSSGDSTGEESISQNILAAGRICLPWLYVEGLQLLLPVTWGCPPLLEAACCFLACWVPPLWPPHSGHLLPGCQQQRVSDLHREPTSSLQTSPS